MIDWIAPAITINSPAAIEYLHTDSLLVSFGATDSLSGLVSATGTIDGAAVPHGQPIPLLTLALGFHTLFVSASDQAGNTSLTTVTFRIVATIDTLIGAVNTFSATGQIDASRGRSLLSKLEDAKEVLSRGNLTAAKQAHGLQESGVGTKRPVGLAVRSAAIDRRRRLRARLAGSRTLGNPGDRCRDLVVLHGRPRRSGLPSG